MFRLLLISLLFAQIPTRPSEGGTITGVLKGADGKPAAGVRIAAVKQAEGALNIATVTAMSSLAETDAQGRFRLEQVPNGRYFVAAGRVDRPTYYPGTLDLLAAKVIDISSGVDVTLGEFAMTDFSIRPEGPGLSLGLAYSPDAMMQIPVEIRVENGVRLPIYSSKGQTLLWLARANDNARIGLQMTGKSMSVPIRAAPAVTEYRATVANLPEGYAVKSMKFGTDDVSSSTFRVSDATPPPLLSVELGATPVAASGSGVTVTGRTWAGDFSVYLSGVSANLYADGTFEFRNVPPGRHAIVVPERASAPYTIGASVVVGTRDVTGVELAAVSALPFAPRVKAEPGSAGTHAPGTAVPLASLRGRLLDESSRRPIAEGTAILTSFSQATSPINTNGDFVIPQLFPGSYNLQIQVQGRTVINRRVTIGDANVDLELTMGAM